ncbi:hypothetical protein IWT25_02307 [Secundilactobacillus pentosiphilus]|uniref:Uncharacterized protein n=1 Tax=Secundilactobacillus pentosiphilus TaxID=1714682 RepID=A0A1Z5IZ74_9LACO|nr:hypothetical protein [Secundilactobacillus pentosiphilus]GAX06959.1 hypothetical protein IWT25_02307 [Secundilactobacillus pentosiphilus]
MSKKVLSMTDKHLNQGKKCTIGDLLATVNEEYGNGNIAGIAFIYQTVDENGEVFNHGGYASNDSREVGLFSLIGGVSQLSADMTRDTFGNV